MTMEFTSFGTFARHLGRLAVIGEEVTHHVVGEAAKIIEKDAKARIGVYQDGTGPFVTWALLADSTEAEKERLGYPLEAPLLREGDLRDSIQSETDGNKAVVGSTSDIALYQEMGTEHIPPRPFLGPAAFENKLNIGERAASIMAAWIGGLGWKSPRRRITEI
jgi:HK97 gp10 family phage protein